MEAKDYYSTDPQFPMQAVNNRWQHQQCTVCLPKK